MSCDGKASNLPVGFMFVFVVTVTVTSSTAAGAVLSDLRAIKERKLLLNILNGFCSLITGSIR
jgi:hypothetical protein